MHGKLFYDLTFGFIDFPNFLAATLYFTGCNLSCPYCYNQQIVGGRPRLSLADIDTELNKTDAAMGDNKVGVVLSGGEPTGNIVAFQKVADHYRAQGRRMALHTNGMNSYRDVFESVTLSLKTTNDGVRDIERYRERMRCVMLHECKLATYRELRVVDYVGARAERNATLEFLKSCHATDGWRVRVIKPQTA